MIILLFISVAIMLVSNAHSQTAKEYNNRGFSKLQSQHSRGAISDYSKVIEIDPNDTSAYLWRGRAKFNLGNPNKLYLYKENACLDFSKAGELGSVIAYDLIKDKCN